MPTPEAADTAASEAPAPPVSTLPSPKPGMSRTKRLVIAVVAVPFALGLVGKAVGLGTPSGDSVSQGTVATAPANPGPTAPPPSSIATTPGAAAPTSPAPTVPSATTTPAPVLMSGSDFDVATTTEGGTSYGGTVTTETATITITNRGDTASVPGTVELTRDGQATPIAGAQGTVNPLSGPSTIGYAMADGVVQLPAIPAGGNANVRVTYAVPTATAGKSAITAVVKAGGAVVLSTSTPTARELG